MFKISKQDIEHSDSLDDTDLGKPAIIINGCIMLFSSEERAKECIDILNKDNKSREIDLDKE